MILTSRAGQRRVLEGRARATAGGISHMSGDITVTRRDVLASANSWSGGPGHCGVWGLTVYEERFGKRSNILKVAVTGCLTPSDFT